MDRITTYNYEEDDLQMLLLLCYYLYVIIRDSHVKLISVVLYTINNTSRFLKDIMFKY